MLEAARRGDGTFATLTETLAFPVFRGDSDEDKQTLFVTLRAFASDALRQMTVRDLVRYGSSLRVVCHSPLGLEPPTCACFVQQGTAGGRQ